MPDREKYIEVLSKTAKAVKEFNEDAPIKISLKCIEDILELLKEQEPVRRTSRTGTNGFSIVWTCGACGSDLFPNNAKAKYCSNCGKAVEWK